MKNNNHRKMVFQDNFMKHWCYSSHNHPSGWRWWKRYNRKQTRRKLKCIKESEVEYDGE